MTIKHKFESNKKYFTISIYSCVVILVACVIFRLVNNWTETHTMLLDLWNTMFPFFMGFLIAYIMNPVVKFFNRNLFTKLLGKKHPKICRNCSIVFTYLLLTLGISLCLFFIIPQVYDSIVELSKQFPKLYENLWGFVQRIRDTNRNPIMDMIADNFEKKTLPSLIQRSNNLIANILPMIYEASISFIQWIFNVFIAFVISIYLTADKKILKVGAKRFIHACFNKEHSVSIIRTLRDCHVLVSSYIVGKSLDSLIIGFLCFGLMSVLQLPYTILISVIVGLTNMIPYFGPFIGAIPGAFILVINSPTKAFIFIIMIIVLQQFDGLILGPKILGSSTGVRPIFILFSITVGGAYFGPLGMFLGVPTFAVIQYLVKRWVNNRLSKRIEQKPQ
ncbi:MAG: AI-2E family transporter [Anaerostipes sp.]|jgi:predicted PurR-regulated permease PerM|nr:AI-2E family transporter [Anaerostipes sp.]MDD3747376.1 AI-2E family transporter [Anaerostipes sp.]